MPNPVLLSSLFGELTKHVQARIDAASELNKRIFDNVIYRKYLDWDTPTIGLDFEEIVGKYNLTVAAATIGENAKEPILGSYGLETVKERVLNHAVTLPMTVQDYRKILQLLDSKSISDEQKKKQLIDLMWGGVQRVVNGVEAKIDIIFLGALQGVPSSVFEAAEVEGLTAWELFWKITLPLISPMILVNLVYTAIDSFGSNDLILAVINQTWYGLGQAGTGAAMTVFYFLCSTLIVLLIVGIVSRVVFYEE